MSMAVSNLSFRYPRAATPTLHGLSFTVAPGEIFGFLGPSGAGKSTTQQILIGLLQDYTGAVQVLGREVSTWGSELYEHIGVAFEMPTHFLKLTALENLTYLRALYRGPTEAPQTLLEAVGLGAEGGRRVSQFSKGMRQRLSLARALLPRPRLLFLDEPTAGLDPANAQRVKALIRAQQAAGRTVFLTTHDMALATEVCDRVAFLVDGELKLTGAPHALQVQYGQRAVEVEYGTSTAPQRARFALDGLRENTAFQDTLTAGILTMHTCESTLEQVFIDVTGRALV